MQGPRERYVHLQESKINAPDTLEHQSAWIRVRTRSNPPLINRYGILARSRKRQRGLRYRGGEHPDQTLNSRNRHHQCQRMIVKLLPRKVGRALTLYNFPSRKIPTTSWLGCGES